MAVNLPNPKAYIAELIGTAILVLVGCVAGMTGGAFVGAVTVAFTFVGMIYCAGKICDCHFNPLITLSMFITGKMDKEDLPWYLIAQVLGGIVGAMLAFLIISQDQYTAAILVGPSLYGRDYFHIEWFGAFIVELLFALVLCYIAMKATENRKIDMKAGAIIAVTLFVIIEVGWGFTYTMVNPAKSIGAAIAMLFSSIDGKFDALIQLWLFIIAPLLGMAIGSFLFLITSNSEFDLNEFIQSKKKTKPVEEEAVADDAVEEAPAEETAETEEVAEEPVADEPAEAVPEEEPVEEPAEDVVIEAEPAEEPQKEEEKLI